MKKTSVVKANAPHRAIQGYDSVLSGLVELLENARRMSARTVNSIMTATYWEIGRRIIEFEQGGQRRAAYGKALLAKLSEDLTRRFGRGFSVDNLERARAFFLAYPAEEISATLSRKSRVEIQTVTEIPRQCRRNSRQRLEFWIWRRLKMLYA